MPVMNSQVKLQKKKKKKEKKIYLEAKKLEIQYPLICLEV